MHQASNRHLDPSIPIEISDLANDLVQLRTDLVKLELLDRFTPYRKIMDIPVLFCHNILQEN